MEKINSRKKSIPVFQFYHDNMLGVPDMRWPADVIMMVVEQLVPTRCQAISNRIKRTVLAAPNPLAYLLFCYLTAPALMGW